METIFKTVEFCQFNIGLVAEYDHENGYYVYAIDEAYIKNGKKLKELSLTEITNLAKNNPALGEAIEEGYCDMAEQAAEMEDDGYYEDEDVAKEAWIARVGHSH